MAKRMPSLLALLGLVAVAGYQNREKIGEFVKGLSNDPNGPAGGMIDMAKRPSATVPPPPASPAGWANWSNSSPRAVKARQLNPGLALAPISPYPNRKWKGPSAPISSTAW